MAIEELVLRGSGLVPDFKELQFEGSPTYRFPFHCISQKSLYLPKITISATHQFFQSELLDPKLPIMEHDFRTRLDGREASGNFVFMKNYCLNPRSHRKRENVQLGCVLARSWTEHRAVRSERDLLRDKIREVGRGLSLADTQTGR